MRFATALLMTGLTMLPVTAIQAQISYNPNSSNCFEDYRNKCVQARLRDCRGRYENYRTAGCTNLPSGQTKLDCQNEVDRVQQECGKEKCIFARECQLDIISGRLCARMPLPANMRPYTGCSE